MGGDVDGAIDDYNKKLALAPADGRALSGRGEARRCFMQHSKADEVNTAKWRGVRDGLHRIRHGIHQIAPQASGPGTFFMQVWGWETWPPKHRCALQWTRIQ